MFTKGTSKLIGVFRVEGRCFRSKTSVDGRLSTALCSFKDSEGKNTIKAYQGPCFSWVFLRFFLVFSLRCSRFFSTSMGICFSACYFQVSQSVVSKMVAQDDPLAYSVAVPREQMPTNTNQPTNLNQPQPTNLNQPTNQPTNQE